VFHPAPNPVEFLVVFVKKVMSAKQMTKMSANRSSFAWLCRRVLNNVPKIKLTQNAEELANHRATQCTIPIRVLQLVKHRLVPATTIMSDTRMNACKIMRKCWFFVTKKPRLLFICVISMFAWAETKNLSTFLGKNS
jgi:hypothetical protein